MQSVFETIARSAMRLCESAFGIVSRYDGELMHLAAHAHIAAEAAGLAQRVFPMRPGPNTVLGRAILQGAVVHLADAKADSTYESAYQEAFGNRSSLAAPMLRDGRPIGAIGVGRLEVRPFADNEIELLKTFADQAVIAIENVRLFTELQEKNRALTQAHARVTEALEQQTATSNILRVMPRASAWRGTIRITHVRAAGRARPSARRRRGRAAVAASTPWHAHGEDRSVFHSVPGDARAPGSVTARLRPVDGQ